MTDRALFVRLSAALTGFDGATLEGTGCVDEYLRQFAAVAGGLDARMDMVAMDALAAEGEARDVAIRALILSDDDLGPLARSLIQLWYLGQWIPMPQDWVDRNGSRLKDTARILSLRSYREGLAWVAMGAHPQGAKQQGFGAWALEPPQS